MNLVFLCVCYLSICFAQIDESLKEQNSIKERNRRAQRIATYVRASTASTDGVNPQATLPPVKKDSDSNFQMNFEIADLRNK